MCCIQGDPPRHYIRSTCGGHCGHGPVETVEVVVCIVDSGIDQTGRTGPGTTAACPSLAAQYVPETGHKVGAHRDEDRELYES